MLHCPKQAGMRHMKHHRPNIFHRPPAQLSSTLRSASDCPLCRKQRVTFSLSWRPINPHVEFFCGSLALSVASWSKRSHCLALQPTRRGSDRPGDMFFSPGSHQATGGSEAGGYRCVRFSYSMTTCPMFGDVGWAYRCLMMFDVGEANLLAVWASCKAFISTAETKRFTRSCVDLGNH